MAVTATTPPDSTKASSNDLKKKVEDYKKHTQSMDELTKQYTNWNSIVQQESYRAPKIVF
ncbi:hypothetical protein [Parasediminibacterium sp. JCM 36343]|uniref:hypothetical protein n=1 Tax=Parasediminibacterium sp. JCM 36343 TaxID=3374279 RepID=UPI003979EAAD